jgi:hypothetical protein
MQGPPPEEPGDQVRSAGQLFSMSSVRPTPGPGSDKGQLLLARVQREARRWATLSGRFRTVRNELPILQAHNSFLRDMAMTLPPELRGPPIPDIAPEEWGEQPVERAGRFSATREPWRLRVDFVPMPRGVAGEELVESIIVRDDGYWSLAGGEFEWSDHGAVAVEWMLRAWPLRRLSESTVTEITCDGRQLLEVLDRMGEEPGGGASGLMDVLGASESRVVVDRELGVAVVCEAWVDDMLAGRDELLDLRIDELLVPGLYEPTRR